MGEEIDLTGKVFGRLTVIKEHEAKTPDNKYKYDGVMMLEAKFKVGDKVVLTDYEYDNLEPMILDGSGRWKA